MALMLQMRFSRWAYIFVNTGGMCCTITMPGVEAGRFFTTAMVASVPPVEAPMAMSVSFLAALTAEAMGERSAAAAVAADAAADAAKGAKGAKAWLRAGAGVRAVLPAAAETAFFKCTRAMEAALIFSARSAAKAAKSEGDFSSGLRTKSTAPALSASNTRTGAELTTTTGTLYTGKSFPKNSMPFILGISTSSVTTLGRSCWIFCMASAAS